MTPPRSDRSSCYAAYETKRSCIQHGTNQQPGQDSNRKPLKRKRRAEDRYKQADTGEKQARSYSELAGVPKIVGKSKEAESACYGQADPYCSECFTCH